MIELPEVPTAFVGPVNEFRDWYKRAAPGEWYTYHYGEHLHESMSLTFLKRTVWDFACEGKIYIFQTRHKESPEFFFFQAQKASMRMPHLNPSRVAEGSDKCR